MAKRKVGSEEEEGEEDFIDNSSEEESKSKAKSKTRKGKEKRQKKPVASESESDSSTKEVKPTAKKPKIEKIKMKEKPSSKEAIPHSEGSTIIIKTASDGDKYIELGKKKRATIRRFKGMSLLDIREFYGADGDEKPGKKGISLSLEQWGALKNSSDTIDGLFAALK